MKTPWMSAVALGLLLGAQTATVHAQGAAQALIDADYVRVAAHEEAVFATEPRTGGAPADAGYLRIAAHEGTPYASAQEALEAALDQGNAYLEKGKEPEALERFAAAATLAVQAGSHPELAYALYREGAAHRRRFERLGDSGDLKAAIAYWEQERSIYRSEDYPPGFAALAGFDLGQAYLELARYEDLTANIERGLNLIEASAPQFREAASVYQAVLRPADSLSR